MRLANTTSKLEAYLGEPASTTEPSWYDDNYTMMFSGTTGTLVSHTTDLVALNDTTPVTVVAAPSSGNEVQINRVFLCNLDTISHTIFVRINDSSTMTYFVDGITVTANQTLQYIEGRGWSLSGGGGS